MEAPIRPEVPVTQAPPVMRRVFLPLTVPYITYVLLGINALIFLSGALLGDTLTSWGVLVPGLVLFYRQWWRLLSAGFLHADLIHVGFNLYALYGLGLLLERFFGKARFLGVYFASLLGASVLVTLFSPLAQPTLGASGAIMGILGALLVFYWRYRELLPQGRQFLNELVKMALINVGIGLLPQISMWGHLGGLLFGAGVGYLLSPRYKLADDQTRLVVQPLQALQLGGSLAVIVGSILLLPLGVWLRF